MKATCSRTVHFERKVAGVESADVMFLVTASETSLPGDADAGWTTTITGQKMTAAGYVWSCTKVTYTDGTISYTGKYCIGKCTNFATITEQYVLSASGTTKPSASAAWKETYTPVEGMYLWTRNKLSYTNGSAVSYTTAICIGYIGKNGTNGTSFTTKGKADGHYATYAKWKAAKKEMTSDANPMLIDNASDGRGSEYAIPSILTYSGGATDCAAISKATVGDAYVIGSELWVANASAWVSLGSIQGPAGANGDDGANAVNVYLSPTSIMHKKSDTEAKYAVVCKVKDGNDFVEYSSKEEDGKFLVIVESDTIPDGVTIETVSGEDYFECDFTIPANQEVNADVVFYVVYKKVGYTYTYQIKTIADGEKGDKGDDGADAVDIQMTTNSIAHKKASTSSTYSVTFKVKVGKSLAEYGTDDGKFHINDIPASSLPDGVTYTKTGGTAGATYVTYKLTIAKNVSVNTNFSFVVYYGSIGYSRTFSITTVEDGEPGAKGEKGAILRGPQDWTSLSDGYNFYQGADGEEYKDVVIYSGNYYSCIQTHAKSSSILPTNSEYWKLGDKFELVATSVLLADNAQIKMLQGQSILLQDLSSGMKMLLQGGMMNIYGSQNVANIRIGLDDNGQSILQFYNNDGELCYDLGPGGLDAKNVKSGSLDAVSGYVTMASVTGTENFSTTKTFGDGTIRLVASTLAIDSKLFGGGQNSQPAANGTKKTLYRYTAARLNGKVVKDDSRGLTAELAEKADGKYFTSQILVASDALTNLASGTFILKTAKVLQCPQFITGGGPKYMLNYVNITSGSMVSTNICSQESNSTTTLDGVITE